MGNIAAGLHAAEFRRAAKNRMSLAQARALKPLADELKRIAAIENDEQRQAELVALKKDLPRIAKKVFGESGPLVEQFVEVVGTSLVSGAVEAAALR